MEHILLTFSGNTKDQVRSQVKTASIFYPPDSILKIGKTMISVEQLQTPVMSTLQAKFKKALLACLGDQFSQEADKLIRHIIGSGREYQSDTIVISQQQMKDRQQLFGRECGTGFLLEIGKVFFKSSPQKMLFSRSNLLYKIITVFKIRGGKTCRSAEDAAALLPVWAWLAHINGDLTDPLTILFPAMVAKSADTSARA